MQDILNSFGVSPVLLVAQIINFLIILWLLKRFAYKPIFSMLEKRRKEIQDGIQHAKDAEIELEKALEKEKEILKKAQSQAQVILADSHKQASLTLSQAEEAAKIRVAKMLEDAQREISQETQNAQQQLAKQTGKLAVEILEKALVGMVDTTVQKEVVEKVTRKLKS